MIVYLDESGFAHDMPRTHGYATRGKRCYGVRDWGAKGRTNVIGALIGASLLTVSTFTTNINGDIFHRWMVNDLIPKLPAKTVVVMDNASFCQRRFKSLPVGRSKSRPLWNSLFCLFEYAMRFFLSVRPDVCGSHIAST